ncbi:MAG: GNAT family N-acetyltransferase [Blastocatellia bacterium]|nr:GNAT family N-acetyltransferase [Blastocatellia bacterium]
MIEKPYPFSDLSLARRLERAEALGNVDFVEARAKVFPESGARWITLAGAYAMYDGVRSPLTQTFGLGVFETVTAAEMETIENFYKEREAPVFHEVSPLADLSLLALLNERGYHPCEFTSVMFRPIACGVRLTASKNERIRVRLIEENEHEMWAQTAAEGWSEFTEFADLMLELSRVSTKRSDGLSFLAEIEGKPVATGAMSVSDGVALLAGASTIPESRNQGAQLALLEGRLNYAAEHGCDTAMMCALPGSASQRNAERQGFRIAYTRIKWQLGRPSI